MKVYISYFYHVRNLPPNIVPISTAVSDPDWFHDHQASFHVFTDKRGVLNGIRARELSPYSVTPSSLCSPKCNRNYRKCAFLREYSTYLAGVDFDKLMEKLHAQLEIVGKGDADICLMVYEKPDNHCSEREPLIRWFAAHGVTVAEFEPEPEQEIEEVLDENGHPVSPLHDDYEYYKSRQEDLNNPLSDDYCKYDHD